MADLFWPSSQRQRADPEKLHFVVQVHDHHSWGWGLTTLCGRSGHAHKEEMFDQRDVGFTRDPDVFRSTEVDALCTECLSVILAFYGPLNDC